MFVRHAILIRQSEFFVPGLSLVAVSEGDGIAGHVLFSEIILQIKRETLTTLGLAPMAVLPELQTRGIGSQLVEHGLKKCRELGYKRVNVIENTGFYERFGFTNAIDKRIHPPFSVLSWWKSWELGNWIAFPELFCIRLLFQRLSRTVR